MKNLLGRLMSRPYDELKDISNTWGTITKEPNPIHNDLAIAVYHTMVDRSAVRSAWENLDPDARTFLAWLLNQRNMLSILDDLAANFGREPSEMEPLIERVRRAGFVDVDEVLVRGTRVVSSGDNLYSWAARSTAEATRKKVVSISAESAKVLNEVIAESARPVPFEEPFATLLQGLEQEEVQRIAATWRLPDAGRYYKSELIGVMSEFIGTGQGRELLLGSLTPGAKNLLTYIEEGGGRRIAAEVRSHFKWDERELRAALLPLVQRAIVWDVLSGEKRYLFVPADLVGAGGNGSNGASRAPLFALPKLEAQAPYSFETRLPYELPWDVLTLLASAAQGDLLLTLQDGRITKRHAKKLNEAFLHPGDLKAGSEYIDLAVHLARSLGLLSEREGEPPSLVPGPRLDEWTRLSFEAQRHRIYALWQEDRKWSEPAAYGTIYWWNSDLTGARKRLVQHLLTVPAGQWISLDSFLRRLHASDPFIIWSQDELVRRFGLRALQGFRSHWFEIEARIITDMIRTTLHWLGAVDLGRDKQKRLLSFRVTDEGLSLLDPAHNAEVRSGNGKALLVQPNFEVLVLEPSSQVVWFLLRIADLVRHDRVSVYTLSKESIVRGVEGGLAPGEIVKFLEEHAGAILPQNVAHSVADWGRLMKRLELSRVTLIEVEDGSVLDELSASRKTRRYILQRLSPTTAIARLPEGAENGREDGFHRLAKELRAAGYYPRVAPEPGEEAEPAETASANGSTNGHSANGKTSHAGAGSTASAPRRVVARGSRVGAAMTGTEGKSGTR